jgi:acyl-CoA dehydrogenase
MAAGRALPDPGRRVGRRALRDHTTEAFVPDEDVLGEVGQGFRYAQVRLAPARLTHCMRWLGPARRSHEVALERATTRNVFGRELSDQSMAQALIADNEIELAASRSLLRQAAWDVEHDRDAGVASSRAKVFISEAVGRIVDRSEVHRMSIAKRAARAARRD